MATGGFLCPTNLLLWISQALGDLGVGPPNRFLWPNNGLCWISQALGDLGVGPRRVFVSHNLTFQDFEIQTLDSKKVPWS